MKLYRSNYILIAALFTSAVFSSCSKDNVAAPASPTPIATTGNVTTLAGGGSTGSSNGTGTSASFNYPNGVAVDAAGNVYVADQNNNEIRKVTAAGGVSVFAGSVTPGSSNTSAIGVPASFFAPTGVAVDATGNVYVADFGNNQIRKIASTGAVTALAGSSSKSGNANGTGTAALFNGPSGVAVDAAGNVYVADFGNNLIRKIDPTGVVTTLAGSGKPGSVNALGTAASFSGPRGVAVDATGNVFVADANNSLIREIDPNGNVTTFAGNGKKGYAAGNGTTASFNYPSGVAVDATGNVYVADAVNNLVRKITPAGDVTALAGSGYLSITKPFNSPVGVAVDATGVVYVANEYGNAIQVIK